ncbi:MAG TPA: peptide-methionine (S)-S-oxide reductase [Caldithrix abyssi]|uniref:Peptide methionine sulfoxide reductase MsrA n=1 Tax=Caldithrix abyssi TaxID=187145 RepID=A0A7V1LLC3_CALAY|nr:peptide-methionine (S)-S-oxide reductase [Caldithrix abyssi]
MRFTGFLLLITFVYFGCTKAGDKTSGEMMGVDLDIKVQKGELEVATFAGGCFWCVEAIFEDIEGVVEAVSGYAGGHVKNPTYEQVCTTDTGHAEAVNIYFDPKIISFEDLVYIFWRTHDPTTLNRQGADVGPQYRSAIFYHNQRQKDIAEKSKAETDRLHIYADPIVTEITPFSNFYVAEISHQEYYRRNPNQGYCRLVIDPKVKKFRKQFKDKLKKK